MEERDLVIIGGGPAGYVAAIRGSQMEARVTLIEESKLGGTCLNSGCIPTKLLLHSVALYQTIKGADKYGISISGADLDLTKLQGNKDRLISRHISGIETLLKANRIELISGRARLVPGNQIEIDTGEGIRKTIRARRIIIATGARPIVLPIPGASSPEVINAEEMLNLTQPPESLIIIGGGVIGVEMATMWARLGVPVSIVEMMPHCLPAQDGEIAALLENTLSSDGIRIYCRARVSAIEEAGRGKVVVFSQDETEQKIEAAVVAVSVGYRANIQNLGLEACGVALNKGCISVDERLKTSVSDIYAAGDAIGGIMLAHVSFAEGRAAAENALGENTIIDYRAVPQCIFTQPEIASVGLSEESALSQGYQLQIGRFPFAASAMAGILGERRGLVKIVTDQKYGQILGVHIIGPGATSLIAEAALALKQELTAKELITTIHAHPTLSEALWEAALDVNGETIHARSRNRRQTTRDGPESSPGSDHREE